MNSSFDARKSATIINFPTRAARSKSALELLMDASANTGHPHLNARNRERIRRIEEILESAQEAGS